MKITIPNLNAVKLNIGTDFNLKKQDLASLSFGETQRLKELKESLKDDPKNEKLQEDLKFAQVENQKLRSQVKQALKDAGINFAYGRTVGSFGKQEFLPLQEGEKYDKGVFVIDKENINKLSDFLKEKGVKNVQVETSYLGKQKKYEADPLYMAEVKKVRNANIYQAQVGAHYDSEKKQFLMGVDGLKKSMDIEKKDEKILYAAKDKNLDSIGEVFKAAGLTETGEIKNMPKKETISSKELGDTVVINQKYFFGGMDKEEYDKAPSEVKAMLNDVNRERIAALKENFEGASWNQDVKGFVFTKSENPDWKEKLEGYVKTDKEFCERKTKELDILRPENKIRNEIKDFTNSFGSGNKPAKAMGIN